MADDKKDEETLLDSPYSADKAFKRALGVLKRGEKETKEIPNQPTSSPSGQGGGGKTPNKTPIYTPPVYPNPNQGGGGNNANVPPINVTINPTFNNSPTFTNAPINTNTANGGSVSGNNFSGGNANATGGAGGQGGNVSGVSATGGQGGNATGGSANATGGSATNNNKNTSSNNNYNSNISGAYSPNQPAAATKKSATKKTAKRATSKSNDQYAHEIAVAMEKALLGRYSHIHLPDEEETVFGDDYRKAKEIIDELKETMTNQNPNESNYVKTLGEEAFERLKELYTKNEIEKLKNSGKYSKGDEKKVKSSATKYFNTIIKDGNYEELRKVVEKIIKENYNGRASEFLHDIYGHTKGE